VDGLFLFYLMTNRISITQLFTDPRVLFVLGLILLFCGLLILWGIGAALAISGAILVVAAEIDAVLADWLAAKRGE
jgi:Trk-type K+ transport system membrane component